MTVKQAIVRGLLWGLIIAPWCLVGTIVGLQLLGRWPA